jgi:hypothetical protein
MIIQQLPNIIPPLNPNDGLATRLVGIPTIPAVAIEENSICVCKCNYVEKVFSEVGPIVDWNKNDKTSLLFKKAITSDSITITLYKELTPYTISDDTYGVYYPGTLPNKPLYYGFIVDWNKIYYLLGPGYYNFKITTIIIGVTTVIDSIDYYLQPYSDLSANNTVRIETYNTGNILSSPFDYDGLLQDGWYQSFRIKGKLMPKQPKITTDNYINQDNEIIQIQDKITNDYDLITGLIPAVIADVLIYDNLLANKILISDYNIFNEDVKRQIELRPIDIPEKKVYNFNNNMKFVIKFTSAIDNIIKNNN